ncbi:hypothetical protein H696_04905, partial [Fonticula alba]
MPDSVYQTERGAGESTPAGPATSTRRPRSPLYSMLALLAVVCLSAFGYMAFRGQPSGPSAAAVARYRQSAGMFAPVPGDTPEMAELREHGERHFSRRVIRASPGVYVAVGFALANVILIEGVNGIMIVDTTESLEAARDVRAAFLEHLPQRILDKPVRAIVYTHFHNDHVHGALAFADDGVGLNGDLPDVVTDSNGRLNPRLNGPLDVIAHDTLQAHLLETVGVTQVVTYVRSMRQFGSLLTGSDRGPNSGIGPYLRYNSRNTIGTLTPTLTFKERILYRGLGGVVGADVDIDGTPLPPRAGGGVPGFEGEDRIPAIEIFHCPGESDDQICVFIAATRTLIGADNYYEAFPNIYAIRGTTTRNANQWMTSVDTMLATNPHVLVPCHGSPLVGATTVLDSLNAYRDAIQHVHDQTIFWINRGLTPDDIITQIDLPPELAARDDLRPFYGTVPWAVRAIFQSYLGWFSGEAAELWPLNPTVRAQKLVDLVGGDFDTLLAKAEAAFDPNDAQWALELSTSLLRLNPDHAGARDLRMRSLVAMARRQRSANGHNYYMTQALEMTGVVDMRASERQVRNVMLTIPEERILFRSMSVNLIASEAAGIRRSLTIRFADLRKAYMLQIRNSVLVAVRVPFDDDEHDAIAAQCTALQIQRLGLDVELDEAGGVPLFDAVPPAPYAINCNFDFTFDEDSMADVDDPAPTQPPPTPPSTAASIASIEQEDVDLLTKGRFEQGSAFFAERMASPEELKAQRRLAIEKYARRLNSKFREASVNMANAANALSMTTSLRTFKLILGGANPVPFMMDGSLVLQGSPLKLMRFFRLFGKLQYRPDDESPPAGGGSFSGSADYEDLVSGSASGSSVSGSSASSSVSGSSASSSVSGSSASSSVSGSSASSSVSGSSASSSVAGSSASSSVAGSSASSSVAGSSASSSSPASSSDENSSDEDSSDEDSSDEDSSDDSDSSGDQGSNFVPEPTTKPPKPTKAPKPPKPTKAPKPPKPTKAPKPPKPTKPGRVVEDASDTHPATGFLNWVLESVRNFFGW